MHNHARGDGLIIFGGRGQLGTSLVEAFIGPVISLSHHEFDIVDGDVDELLRENRPLAVINCAAFHNVDRCESEPLSAFLVNAIAVDRLARACATRDVTFVTVSTDYVFSGSDHLMYCEDDRPNPKTTYGTSKLAGELLARRHGPKQIVVRTSGVFGTIGTSGKGYTLIDKVLAQAERGELTRMVDDMTFSPSYAPHVADAMLKLIAREAFGTHHVTNSGSCTWFEFVRVAFQKAGLGDAPLEAIHYAALSNPTRRPAYSPLKNTTFAALGISALPTWQEALDEFLAVRKATNTAPQI